MKKNNDKQNKIEISQEQLIIQEGTAYETIKHHREAIKAHENAYDRGLTDKTKSIKNIVENKQGKPQKMGEVAEEMFVADQNEKLILERKKPIIKRTDDIPGRYNDELVDIDVDNTSRGHIGKHSLQLKVIGGNGEFVNYSKVKKDLLSGKYDKYMKKGVKIGIPDDCYKELVNEYKIKLNELQNTSSNDIEKINQLKKEVDSLKKLKENTKSIEFTYDKISKTVDHPKLNLVGKKIKLANKAGLEQMKYGAIIAGSISLTKNLVACIKHEKDPKEAGIDVAKSIGIGMATSYATAFSGTLIQGMLDNSNILVIKEGLSKTSIASGLVSTSVSIGKSVKKCIGGDISFEECIVEIANNEVGEIGATIMTGLGISMLPAEAPPLAVMGASMSGSFVGYAVATAIYKEISESAKEFNLAKKEREQISKECEEILKLLKEYRNDLTNCVEKYMSDYINMFNDNFSIIDEALIDNDMESFIKGNISIQQYMGRHLQFKNEKELNDFMESEETLIL